MPIVGVPEYTFNISLPVTVKSRGTPAFDDPVPLGDVRLTLKIVGAVVSIVKDTAVVAELWFPAASVALTVMVCAPVDKLEDGVNVHAPAVLAVVVPKVVAPSKTVMIALASDVPTIAGTSVFV